MGIDQDPSVGWVLGERPVPFVPLWHLYSLCFEGLFSLLLHVLELIVDLSVNARVRAVSSD